MPTCPYSSRTHAKPEFFANRKEIINNFKRFLSYLESGYSAGFAIIGESGSGKTSLLYRFLGEIPNEMLPVFLYSDRGTQMDEFMTSMIDLLEVKHNAKVPLKRVFFQKVRKLPRKIVTDIRFSQVDFSGFKLDIEQKTRTPFVAMNLVLDKLASAGTNIIVIIVDNAETIPESGLKILREVAERGQPSIGIVMAGQKTFIERIRTEYPQFLRLFSGFTAELKPFGIGDTKEALELPLRGTEMKWTQEAIKRVQDLSQGSPYNVIHIAEMSYESLQGSGEFTAKSIQKAYPEYVGEMIGDKTLLYSPSIIVKETQPKKADRAKGNYDTSIYWPTLIIEKSPASLYSEKTSFLTVQSEFQESLRPSFQNGEILVGKKDSYVLEENAAIGGIGEIYVAHGLKNTKKVVIKIPRTKEGFAQILNSFFIREAELLKNMSHSNIIALIDEVMVNEGFGLVLEFLPDSHSLDFYNGKPLSESETVWILRQILSALDYIHSLGVIHGDLKPGNVLLTAEGQVKLIDFGLAITVESDRNVIAGSPSWAAPEQLASRNKITPAADFYAIGAITFFLLTGQVPNKKVKSPISVNSSVSEGMSKFVDICMDENPSKRFSDITSMLSYIDNLKVEPKENSTC